MIRFDLLLYAALLAVAAILQVFQPQFQFVIPPSQRFDFALQRGRRSSAGHAAFQVPHQSRERRGG